MTPSGARADRVAGRTSIDEAVERARQLVNDGRPELARETLRRALTSLDAIADVEIRQERHARVLGLLSLVDFETTGLEAALARLDEAAVSADLSGDAAAVALVWSQRANVLGRSGDLTGAIAALDIAAEHVTAMSVRDGVILRMNRGVARSQTGQLVGAIEDLSAAAMIARGHGLLREQFMATHNLGYLHHLRGDVPAALAAMEEAHQLDVDVSRGVSLLDRGRVLLEAGLVDEATRVLDQAVEVCLADEQHHVADEARYERARAALLRGRLDQARAEAATAAEGFADRGTTIWLERCHLLDLRVRLLQLPTIGAPGATPTEREAAAAIAREAGALAERQAAAGNETTARAALVLAAEAAALAGDPATAARLLPPEQPSGLPRLTVRLADRLARARVAVGDGRDEDARREVWAAADDLARATATATTLDLRTAGAIHAARLSRLDLLLAEDDPLMTLLALERWRAPGSRVAPVRPPEDDDTAAMLLERRQLLEQLRDDAGVGEDGWQRLAVLEEDIAAQRRAATSRRAQAAAGMTPHALLLEALAGDHRDLVTTAVRDGEVLVLHLSGGLCSSHVAGTAEDVAALAHRIRTDLRALATIPSGPLADVARRSFDAAMTDLRDRILPSSGLEDGRRLLVVPHGALGGMPWGAVATDHPVVVAASATAWARAQLEQGRTVREGGLAVVLGPRLSAAHDEVAAVADAWGKVVTTSTATGADLVAALRDAGVVHVAAHGRHHREQPLFSSLELGDGVWCLYDVEATGVGASQVVLASCETGDASVRPGDEPLGLANGLLALGAQSVVAPVCPVPDDRLPAVMGRLHRALAANVPTDEALLRATKEDTLARAAFVVVGRAVRTAR